MLDETNDAPETLEVYGLTKTRSMQRTARPLAIASYNRGVKGDDRSKKERSAPALAPWRTITRRALFSGGPIQEIAVEAVELPTGQLVPDYYQIRLPDYVLIYAEMEDGT